MLALSGSPVAAGSGSGKCTVSYLIEKLMAIYHSLALIGFLCPCGAVN